MNKKVKNYINDFSWFYKKLYTNPFGPEMPFILFRNKNDKIINRFQKIPPGLDWILNKELSMNSKRGIGESILDEMTWQSYKTSKLLYVFKVKSKIPTCWSPNRTKNALLYYAHGEGVWEFRKRERNR